MNRVVFQTLYPQLVFPKPPFRIDESTWGSPTLDSAVPPYLRQITDWRAAVLEFVGPPGVRKEQASAIIGLTERAREALETFLSSSWSESMTEDATRSPYNLTCFPAAASETAPGPDRQTLLQILQWRAGIVDYLGDVWDVVGEPRLDLDECTAVELFLQCASPVPVCHLCLTEFTKAQVHPDAHGCLLLQNVRAKWPVVPIFEQWKNEASRSDDG
ncbi:MAG TPA: hypothetical protein VNU68_33295 [Verrucomicrobiae bacterium]|nr:hypothetical protein [Verrucomicrobiae bacterium]